MLRKHRNRDSTSAEYGRTICLFEQTQFVLTKQFVSCNKNEVMELQRIATYIIVSEINGF